MRIDRQEHLTILEQVCDGRQPSFLILRAVEPNHDRVRAPADRKPSSMTAARSLLESITATLNIRSFIRQHPRHLRQGTCPHRR
jgi:hypothetical protein